MRFSHHGLRHVVLVLSGLCAVLCLPGCMQDPNGPDDWESSIEPPEFSAEVKSILGQKTQLVEKLAVEERVVSAVRTANEENRTLTKPDILARDARWQATEGKRQVGSNFGLCSCSGSEG